MTQFKYGEWEEWMKKAHRYHSCERKVKYGHEQTAVTAASVMKDKTGEKLHAYKCQYCDGWHIGHEPYTQETVTASAQLATSGGREFFAA